MASSARRRAAVSGWVTASQSRLRSNPLALKRTPASWPSGFCTGSTTTATRRRSRSWQRRASSCRSRRSASAPLGSLPCTEPATHTTAGASPTLRARPARTARSRASPRAQAAGGQRGDDGVAQRAALDAEARHGGGHDRRGARHRAHVGVGRRCARRHIGRRGRGPAGQAARAGAAQAMAHSARASARLIAPARPRACAPRRPPARATRRRGRRAR